jgi:hypothetical protein
MLRRITNSQGQTCQQKLTKNPFTSMVNQSYYSLQNEVRHPELLNAHQFLQLARDCEIVNGRRIVDADINITFKAARMQKATLSSAVHNFIAKTQDGNQGPTQSNMMPYTRFLNALVMLSKKAFPNENSDEVSFERLLAEHILPVSSSLFAL